MKPFYGIGHFWIVSFCLLFAFPVLADSEKGVSISVKESVDKLDVSESPSVKSVADPNYPTTITAMRMPGAIRYCISIIRRAIVHRTDGWDSGIDPMNPVRTDSRG